MRRRALRLSVSLALAVAVAAPAWAMCGMTLVANASRHACPMMADDHCGARGPRASGNCCVSDSPLPDPSVPPAVISGPDQRLAKTGQAALPARIVEPAPGTSFGIVARALLKPPRIPTHLRNTSLLI